MSWNIAKPGDQINGSLVVTGSVSISSTLAVAGNFSLNQAIGTFTNTTDADTTTPIKLVNAGTSANTEVCLALQPGNNAARMAQWAAINDGSGNVTVQLRTSAAGAATTKFTVLPNGKVGIGTATPGTTLHVVGTGSKIRISTNATDSGTIDLSADSSSAIINAKTYATAVPLKFQIDDSDKLTISNTGVFTWSNVGGGTGTAMTLNSTGLGIGGSPSTALTLGSGTILIKNASGDLSGLRIYQDTGDTSRIYNFYSGSLVLGTNNSGKVWIDTSGNVGIGESIPYARLELKGSSNGYGSSGSVVFSDNSGDANSRRWLIGNVTPVNYGSLVIANSSSPTGSPTNVIATFSRAGNLGLGVEPSNAKLEVLASAAPQQIIRTSAASGYVSLRLYNDQNSSVRALTIDYSGSTYSGSVIMGGPSGECAAIATTGSYPLVLGTNNTARITIDASGNHLVGKNSASILSVGVEHRPNGKVITTMAESANTQDTYEVYSTGASAYRFYVGMGGTVYATNTTISAISDRRFKENIEDIDVGLSQILALKPRKFDWKEGKGKDIKGDRGFIAQEFEQVFPNLIDEWKDEAPEGEEPYKSVRQDLIPVLVKAIQELTARVQTLENA